MADTIYRKQSGRYMIEVNTDKAPHIAVGVDLQTGKEVWRREGKQYHAVAVAAKRWLDLHSKS